MAPPVKTQEYEALTHLSVHRDREPGEAPGMAGADLKYVGEKVELDEMRAGRLLELGSIRPWSERNEPRPRVTARDMSGRSFPDQPVAVQPAINVPQPAQPSQPATAPEATDPQPTGPSGSVDPYATGTGTSKS